MEKNREKNQNETGGEKRGELRRVGRKRAKVEKESCTKPWYKSHWEHRKLWTGGISG